MNPGNPTDQDSEQDTEEGFKIIITKRSDDYHACIAGETGRWDSGKNPAEAVGNLMRTHPEMFSFTIEWPEN